MIVIGSGAGGGVLAKELSEAGLQVTVLEFSCLVTTQCSMTSAVGGGSWLRMGGGVAATGVFFAAQPASSRQNTSPGFLMFSVFALSRPLVDGNLGYTSKNPNLQVEKKDRGHGSQGRSGLQ